MNLRLSSRAFGTFGLFFAIAFQNGLAFSGSGISPSAQSLSLALTTLFTISDLPRIHGIPPYFAHRMSPASNEGSVEESDEDEEDNESQARVEPQITPLNRDECLAKLLCGMSVPVTGGMSPKNGYYSEYAQIVAKFFDAFPLEEDENNSHESLEAYDDYSVEDTRPTRLNSKKKPFETTAKPSSGLQLFDLALVKTAKPDSNKTQTEDDERNDRSIWNRAARARKIIQKLGEKLQTVRQCQQISGCPFTFKQLRSKLKSTPSISSNMALGTPSINYKPSSKPKPLSTEISLGRPQAQSDEPSLAFKDPHKGDDELEEFFGPPPVVIHRPAGFGINQMMGSSHNKNKPQNPSVISQYQYQPQNDANQYNPYNPPVRYTPNLAPQKVSPGSMFPKKKVGYQIPSFVVKKHQSGENDEFDDVNKSTGPVTLLGGDTYQQQQPHQQQQYQQQQQQQQQQIQNAQQLFNNQGNNKNNENGQEQLNEDDDNNDSEGDYDDDDTEYDDDDEDEGGNDNENNNDDSNEEEEDEEEVSKEEKDDEKKSSKKKASSKDKEPEQVTVVKKQKIKGYKKPSFAPQGINVEDDFDIKKPNSDDDESNDPDNLWSKFAFATTGGLLKEPKERNKTKLQEKNDQKLNISTESNESNEKDKKAEDSDEEEEEEDESRSEKRPTKFSYHDDEEFETTKDGYFLSSSNPSQKSKPKYRKSSSSKSKSRTRTPAVKKEPKKPQEQAKSEEEQSVTPDPKKTMLTQIGGRPLVPEPEKETGLPKKTSPLSRFNFNLIRPYQNHYSSSNESPSKATKTRSSLPVSASLPTYTKPKAPTSESNSFKKEPTGTQSESYLPSVSFGASNGGKVGTVEYLGAPSTQTQARPSLTFPFGGTLSTLKSFFKRPGSSQSNLDIPGGNHQMAPHSPFVHRPVGPESSNYKRHSSSSSSSSSSNKGRSDKKKSSKKSSNGRGKKGSRY